MSISGLGQPNTLAFAAFDTLVENLKQSVLNQGPNLTISNISSDIFSLGGIGGIILENPTIGPEDIPLTEFLQQMDSLGSMVGNAVIFAAGALLLLNEAAQKFGEMVGQGGEAFVQGNANGIVGFAGQLAGGIEQSTSTMYDLLNSGTYPDYTDFLKEMLHVAEELKKLSSDVKQAALEGQYQNLLDQAQAMKDAAQATYDSTMAEIQASRDEAWGKIAGGIASVLTIAVGGFFGGSAGAQLGGQLGTAFGQISEGAASQIAADKKEEGALKKLESDRLQALKTTLEASAKLMQSQEQVADELKETAKSLRDAVFKIYQDFISSQSQIVQRANI